MPTLKKFSTSVRIYCLVAPNQPLLLNFHLLILVIVVLGLHDLVTQAKDGPVQFALGLVICWRIEFLLQAFVERDHPSGTAIDGRPNLNVPDGIETKFLGDSFRDHLHDPVRGGGGVFGGEEEEVAIPFGKFWKFTLVDEMGIGDDSGIITNAHLINQGKFPKFSKGDGDFFLFPAEDAASAADWIVEVVSERIPQKFGFDAVRDIQVRSPIYRGPAGVIALNERLQEKLNPPADNKPERKLYGTIFRLGDKVMQTQNNYDKDQ